MKNTHQRQPSASDDAALSQTPKRVPDGSVHAPHGLLPRELEPQELLRNSMHDLTLNGSHERTVSPSSRDGKHTKTSSRDLMSEIDDYIESINENFAAYTRDSVKTPKKKAAKPVVETPKSAIKVTDKSFSQNSVVPTNDEADSFFGSSPEEGDFSDPKMTEKSLKDIGFSHSHNKYLSKSRNFVNQRTKAQSVKPVSVHLSSDISDWVSTTPQAFNQSYLFDSPQSSPYSSDSSVDKENQSRRASRTRTNVPLSDRKSVV